MKQGPLRAKPNFEALCKKQSSPMGIKILFTANSIIFRQACLKAFI